MASGVPSLIAVSFSSPEYAPCTNTQPNEQPSKFVTPTLPLLLQVLANYLESLSQPLRHICHASHKVQHPWLERPLLSPLHVESCCVSSSEYHGHVKVVTRHRKQAAQMTVDKLRTIGARSPLQLLCGES
jgi:hypothetical protein